MIRRMWLLLAAVAGCGTCAPRDDGRAPAAMEPVAAAARTADPVGAPRLTTRGADAFAINEAVSIPRPWVERGTFTAEQEAAMLARKAKAAADLGATMVRATTQTYPFLDMSSLEKAGWDWTRADRWVRAVQDADLDAVMMVGPWPGTKTAAYTDRYLPADLDAYDAYVRRVVERYDGDGVDDMPGLSRPVHAWEVDNEPDLHNRRPPKGHKAKVDPKLFQTPEEYAVVLEHTARAIRQADPNAVVLGGAFYNARSGDGRAYAESLAQRRDAIDAFDVISLHCYFDEDDLAAVDQTLAAARDVFPGKALWITETGVPSGEQRPWQTEQWQARMVAGVYGAFLAGGAERIMWHTLNDPPAAKRASNPFGTHSLMQAVAGPARGRSGPAAESVVDKPSGALYRRLSGLLADTRPADYRSVEAPGGLLLWTGSGWLAYWGNPTLPEGAGAVTDLLTGAGVTAAGTVSAPAWIAPR